MSMAGYNKGYNQQVSMDPDDPILSLQSSVIPTAESCSTNASSFVPPPPTVPDLERRSLLAAAPYGSPPSDPVATDEQPNGIYRLKAIAS